MFMFPLLPFFVFVALFLGPLLLKREVFVTPDFGLSDLVNFYIPIKQSLADSLRSGQLPFWNTQAGMGTPLLAEGQVGALQPFNIILFGFLPFEYAFILSYFFIFLTAYLGTYLYLRTLGCRAFSSYFAAFAFTFSAIFIVRIVHFDVVQTLSFFPWLLFILELALQKRKPSYLLFLTLIVTLQILSGHLQTALYSLIFVTFYFICRFVFDRPLKGRRINTFIFAGFFVFFIFLGVSLAGAQLLPSWELASLGGNVGYSFSELLRFPFTVKNFLSYISPYILGDPRIGTYPPYGDNWGIFWEHTGYMGFLPIIFALSSLFLITKNRFVKIYWLLAAGMAILTLGKYSPTFIFFEFPPLSFFRVPSRFIFFLTFSLAILSAFSLDYWLDRFKRYSKTVVILSVIAGVILFADLFSFARFYHLTGSFQEWFKCPTTGTIIKPLANSYRIYSYGNVSEWNNVFLKRGWAGLGNEYLALRNNLDSFPPYQCGLSHVDDHRSGLSVPRQRLLSDAILQSFKDSNDKEASVSAEGVTLLSLSSAKYIVTPKRLVNSPFLLIQNVSESGHSYAIYENGAAVPRARVVGETYKVDTLEQFFRSTGDTSYSPSRQALVEDDYALISSPSGSFLGKATILQDKQTFVEIGVTSQREGLLVLADTYYPGWHAYINKQEVPLYHTDLAFRGVKVSKGTSTVQFIYKPRSFIVGAIISGFAALVLLICFFILRTRLKNY